MDYNLLFPFAGTLCSRAAMLSLLREILSCSLPNVVRTPELVGSEETSDLLIPLTPWRDFNLQLEEVY